MRTRTAGGRASDHTRVHRVHRGTHPRSATHVHTHVHKHTSDEVDTRARVYMYACPRVDVHKSHFIKLVHVFLVWYI